MSGIIGLLTDFGLKDYYVSAVKAVILSIAPDARIIDISHEVEKWNIVQGAFILRQVSGFFPDEAVIMGVVDPGVGGRRRPIVIKGRRHYFVGPDNGLLAPAAESEGVLKVVEIRNGRYMLERSGTFDGRDVFAPVAAYIVNGVPVSEFGPETLEYVKITFPKPIFKPNEVFFHVLHIDQFGNVVTNIPIDKFSKWRGEQNVFKVEAKSGGFKLGFSRSYVESDFKVFLIPGSSGFIEISMKMMPASKYLKLEPGDEAVLAK